MTELEKHLLAALEQTQQQQKQREADLFKMFETTRQENQEIRAEFQSLLLNITETEQNRNENLNKLVRLISSLNSQLQDFKTQNAALTNQLQVLEQQVSKLKKWMSQHSDKMADSPKVTDAAYNQIQLYGVFLCFFCLFTKNN